MVAVNFTGIDLIACVSAGILLLYWYLTNTFDYWRKRNVLNEKPYPFIGTEGDALRLKQHPGVLLYNTYFKYPNEKLFGGFVFRTPVLTVKDPDVIKNIFVKNFNNFVDRGFTAHANNSKDPMIKYNLFFSNGDTWKGIRQKWTPTFTSKKMRSMFPLILEVSIEFEKYLREITGESGICDVKELTAKYTTDIIGSCAFGIRMNSLNDENAPFRIIGRGLAEPSFGRNFKLGLMQMLPFIYNLFRLRITTIKEENFFMNLVESVMKSRNYEASPRHDFIDLLIELKMKGTVGEENIPDLNKTSYDIKITDEILAAQAFVFFTAGFETSSTTTTMTLYELAKNQNIQTRLIEEIHKVLNKYENILTYEALTEMSYLKMVINETLRMYPPVLLLNRICTESCTLGGTDIKLDKGVLINIPVYAMHHDPKYFPEPEEFIPERFTPEAEANRHPFVYMPFGEGPRICIGMRFALLQTMMGIISILRTYKVDVNEKTTPKINISADTFTLCSKNDILLTFTKRK